MSHHLSIDDQDFKREFEACATPPDRFDHRAHVRLAYIYLCESAVEEAAQRMKTSLLAFLAHLGVDESKYHETITRAWILAVRHFMDQSQGSQSAEEFISANPVLLDSKIMLTHYSAEVLFSPGARQSFVEPDLQSIPPPPTSAQEDPPAEPADRPPP